MSDLQRIRNWLRKESDLDVDLTITTPQEYQVFQADENGDADIPIEGTCVGAVGLEANIDGGAYSAVTLSAGEFVGEFAGRSDEDVTIAVRFAERAAIVQQVEHVGVGGNDLIIGASNNKGLGFALQEYESAGPFAGKFYLGAWGNLADPTNDTDIAGSYHPLLATRWLARTGKPYGIINCAVGGTGFATGDYLPGTSTHDGIISKVRAARPLGIDICNLLYGGADMQVEGLTVETAAAPVIRDITSLQIALPFRAPHLVDESFTAADGTSIASLGWTVRAGSIVVSGDTAVPSGAVPSGLGYVATRDFGRAESLLRQRFTMGDSRPSILSRFNPADGTTYLVNAIAETGLLRIQFWNGSAFTLIESEDAVTVNGSQYELEVLTTGERIWAWLYASDGRTLIAEVKATGASQNTSSTHGGFRFGSAAGAVSSYTVAGRGQWPVLIHVSGQFASAAPARNVVRQAERYVVATRPDMFLQGANLIACGPYGDGVHAQTPEELARVAELVEAAKAHHQLGVPIGISPEMTGVTVVDGTHIDVAFTVQTPPLQITGADTVGWRVTHTGGSRSVVSAEVLPSGTDVRLTLDAAVVGDLVSWGYSDDAVGATLRDSSDAGLCPFAFIEEVAA